MHGATGVALDPSTWSRRGCFDRRWFHERPDHRCASSALDPLGPQVPGASVARPRSAAPSIPALTGNRSRPVSSARAAGRAAASMRRDAAAPRPSPARCSRNRCRSGPRATSRGRRSHPRRRQLRRCRGRSPLGALASERLGAAHRTRRRGVSYGETEEGRRRDQGAGGRQTFPGAGTLTDSSPGTTASCGSVGAARGPMARVACSHEFARRPAAVAGPEQRRSGQVRVRTFAYEASRRRAAVRSAGCGERPR